MQPKNTDIIYLQSAANYTQLHTTAGWWLSSYTLKIVLARLQASQYLLVRRGLAINKMYISHIHTDRYDPYVLLHTGQRIGISRRQLKLIKETLPNN